MTSPNPHVMTSPNPHQCNDSTVNGIAQLYLEGKPTNLLALRHRILAELCEDTIRATNGNLLGAFAERDQGADY